MQDQATFEVASSAPIRSSAPHVGLEPTTLWLQTRKARNITGLKMSVSEPGFWL